MFAYFLVYGPPSIVSVVIRPTFYQYGDDVELTCVVESNPDYDQLGWNMLVNTDQFKGRNIKLSYSNHSLRHFN